MYKTVSVSALLAAILAYLLYFSPQSLPRLSNLTNITAPEEMSLQSVSRHVVKKVLAVETAEVCTKAYARESLES